MFFNSKSIANNQKNSTEVNIKKLVKKQILTWIYKGSLSRTHQKKQYKN